VDHTGSGSIELQAHAAALSEAIGDGRTVPAGRLFGLPELPGDDCWLDMAGAAAITGAPPKTITGWLARGGPVRNPFPVPHRFLYRLYWRRTEITSWHAREPATAQRTTADLGRTGTLPGNVLSDFGSEAGAATCPQIRSGAVTVVSSNAVNCAYAAYQRRCTGGGGVRDEEAGSSNLPTPTI
jgi:hypothetical protein